MMDPRQLFADERLTGICIYCGGSPDTRDHVPSRILLDDPLPENLAVVDACTVCNQSFSLDEEYLACFLECVLAGSTDTSRLSRDKINRALSRNARLSSRIQASARIDDHHGLTWEPEYERVQHIAVKLARGHAAYELSLPQLDDPESVFVSSLLAMTKWDRKAFENAGLGEPRLLPEVGSRAFFRAVGARPYGDQAGPWVVVQPGRYRYSVDQFGGIRVQIVLAEYLACAVEWI
jgi:hypothetical protein